MSLNAVAISGNLGKDAELRVTTGGTSVLAFSVAVNERRRQSDGTYKDKANWIDCVMFGKRAEGIQPYLRRGSKLSLTGRISQNKYEHDGKTYSRIEVIVDEVELMNTRRESQQSEPAPAQPSADVADADIPF